MDVWEENLLIYRAFWDLTPERANGFGEGVIPFGALSKYCRESGYFTVMEVLPFIRAMDIAYLEYKRQKQEEEKDERDQRQAKRSRFPNER